MVRLPHRLRRLVILPTGGFNPFQDEFPDYRNVFQDVVLLLRAKFPSLRRIRFAAFFPRQYTYTVHADPDRSEELDDVWHIDCVEERAFQIDRAPTPISSPLSLSPDYYTARYRFDVRFDAYDERDSTSSEPSWVGEQEHVDSDGSSAGRTHSDKSELWVAAMKEAEGFEGLYRVADFGMLSLALEDIGEIAQRQISSGHPVADRLRTITAGNIAPYEVYDFELFASAVSASLTSLKLGTESFNSVRITFADLPAIFAIIKSDLPLLRDLTLAVGGIADAEAVCRGFMTPGILSERGTLHSICIDTAYHPTKLFSALRYLAQYCREDPNPPVMVSHDRGYTVGWSPEDQRSMIRYLRE